LRVVFPGRRWGGPGPDFQGAVLATLAGQLIRGDVEVHVRARGWVQHQHAADPNYARVILHVVQVADAVIPTHGPGWHVPTVALLPMRGPPPAGGRRRGRRAVERAPCTRSPRRQQAVVEAAGRLRFEARAARFEADLTVVEPDQAVWRGVAEALGYQGNVAPFATLADGLPWLAAAEVVQARGRVGLAGVLLGLAGLIREATLPEAHAWRWWQRQRGARPLLASAAWRTVQVRAANHPAVRCRGLAALAARWQAPSETRGTRGGEGPAAVVLAAVDAAAGQRRPQLWTAVAAGPWIGRGRAQAITINVLLPFAVAAGSPVAAALFERLPGEPPNRVVRYMAAQLNLAARPASPLPFRSAWHQQGLLQLFHTTCAVRDCAACPARSAESDATNRRLPTSNG
jgi:hypothetical protein